MTPHLRPACRGDAGALARLAAQLGYPTDGTAMERRLDAVLAVTERAVFVAEHGGEIVGWIDVSAGALLQEDPGAEIQGLVVAESHRGSGVGRALVARAEAWAVEHDLGLIRVRSRSSRTGAHRFYRTLGYEMVKTSVAFRKRL